MSLAAQRYARALLSVSGADTDKAADALEALAQAVETNAELQVVMNDPRLAPQRLEVLSALTEKLQGPKSLVDFLKVLVESDRLSDLTAIAEAFRKLADEKASRVRGTVVSAVALNDADKQNLQGALERQAGKKITLDFSVDAALIGGVVARVEGLVWDGSVRTQLANLKQSLTSGL